MKARGRVSELLKISSFKTRFFDVTNLGSLSLAFFLLLFSFNFFLFCVPASSLLFFICVERKRFVDRRVRESSDVDVSIYSSSFIRKRGTILCCDSSRQLLFAVIRVGERIDETRSPPFVYENCSKQVINCCSKRESEKESQ